MHSVLKAVGLTKRFKNNIAVNNVDFEVGRSEIHALIGENGAGKSTLCKMFTGLYSVDEGSIEILGEKKYFQSPADSIKSGIGMLYQERNLVPFLNAAENISLGHEPRTKLNMIDTEEIIRRAEKLRKELDVDIPLDVPVEELGAGEQQLVEIMRAFYMNPKILILDEPTSSLGEGEIEPFLKFVTKLKNENDVSIIYITHKLEEITKIADKVTVLADGAVTLNANMSEVSLDDCVYAMIGSDKIKKITIPEKQHQRLEPILKVKELFYDNKAHKLDFELFKGEVVGFYGLVGSGRTELMEALFGIRPIANSYFELNGEIINNPNTFSMIKHGLILTPELRANGIFPLLSLTDNICSLFIDNLSSKIGVYYGNDAKQFANKVLEKNYVRYANSEQQIIELSGGNMQKIIIGRSIEVSNLSVIILDEPTVGMDLGAKSEIYLKVRQLADEQNIGVIFVSSELDELISISDRMYIMFRGDCIAHFERDSFDKEQILNFAVRGVGLGEK